MDLVFPPVAQYIGPKYTKNTRRGYSHFVTAACEEPDDPLSKEDAKGRRVQPYTLHRSVC